MRNETEPSIFQRRLVEHDEHVGGGDAQLAEALHDAFDFCQGMPDSLADLARTISIAAELGSASGALDVSQPLSNREPDRARGGTLVHRVTSILEGIGRLRVLRIGHQLQRLRQRR